MKELQRMYLNYFTTAASEKNGFRSTVDKIFVKLSSIVITIPFRKQICPVLDEPIDRLLIPTTKRYISSRQRKIGIRISQKEKQGKKKEKQTRNRISIRSRGTSRSDNRSKNILRRQEVKRT